jgi:hypothetical protein
MLPSCLRYITLHRSLARELFAANKKIVRTCLLVGVVGHGTKRKRRTRATHRMRRGLAGRRAHHEETESGSVSARRPRLGGGGGGGGGLRGDKAKQKGKSTPALITITAPFHGRRWCGSRVAWGRARDTEVCSCLQAASTYSIWSCGCSSLITIRDRASARRAAFNTNRIAVRRLSPTLTTRSVFLHVRFYCIRSFVRF